MTLKFVHEEVRLFKLTLTTSERSTAHTGIGCKFEVAKLNFGV